MRNIIFYFLEVNLRFTSMVYALDVVSKKYLHNPKSQRFSSVCSRSSIYEGFIFNSMTHFELTLVYGARCGSKFLFFLMYVQLFQHQFLKRFYFLHWHSFLQLCQKSEYVNSVLNSLSILNSLWCYINLFIPLCVNIFLLL